MMDRKSSIALVAAGREIRAAVRKLEPLVDGEEATAALAELRAIAHVVEMLPSAPTAQPSPPVPLQWPPARSTGPLDPLPVKGNSPARRRARARPEITGVTSRG